MSLPHWPQSPPKRAGVGDVLVTGTTSVQSGAAALNGNYDPILAQAYSNLTPDQQLAFGKLSGDVKSGINSVVQKYGQVAPALALAGKISGGGVPNEAEIIGGLSAVATMVGGPIAGAAFGAMGAAVIGFEELLKGLFTALGLYDNAPKYDFNGLIRKTVDVVPYGPASSNWIRIDSVFDLQNFIFNGQSGHPPLNNETGFDGRLLSYIFFPTLLQAAAGGVTEACEFASGHWENGRWLPGPCDPTKLAGIYRPNAFDIYFVTILKKNLQNWANGQPYLQPRDVLRNCSRAWNTVHAGNCGPDAACSAASGSSITQIDSQTICYAPPGVGYGRGTGLGGNSISIVNKVLGVDGDYPNYLNEAPPLCVNMGGVVDPGVAASASGITDDSAFLQSAQTQADIAAAQAAPVMDPAAAAAFNAAQQGKSAATGMSTGEKIAIGAGVVGVMAVGGTLLYARATHQPAAAVVKHALRKMTGRR